jgi:hypothetical protein
VKRIITRLMIVLGRNTDENETKSSSAEEIGTRRSRRRGKRKDGHQPRDFSVESAAEMLDAMPSDVSRESALRIVRWALTAGGIEVGDLERSTRARESKLNSEIELAQHRQKEFREQTEEAVRSLEEEIRKVKEAYDTVFAEEEKKISRASTVLKDVRRVRAFFDFSKTSGDENTALSAQDTQPLSVISTQERRRSGPPAVTDSPPTTDLLKTLPSTVPPTAHRGV